MAKKKKLTEEQRKALAWPHNRKTYNYSSPNAKGKRNRTSVVTDSYGDFNNGSLIHDQFERAKKYNAENQGKGTYMWVNVKPKHVKSVVTRYSDGSAKVEYFKGLPMKK